MGYVPLAVFLITKSEKSRIIVEELKSYSFAQAINHLEPLSRKFL